MHSNSTTALPLGKVTKHRVSNRCQSDTSKPAKPYSGYPLFAHATNRWAKKILGKLHYFGPWDDPDAALEKYLAQKDDLHAGRSPRASAGEVRVKDLANQFRAAKEAARDAGEITQRTLEDYEAVADLIVSSFGKHRLLSDIRPEDFASLRKKLAKKWSPRTLGNVVNRIRVAFKWAHDNGLLDRPIIYGSSFKRPSKKTLRIDRAKKGPKLFTRDEILAMLNASDGQLRAMILLGINGGFGNSDCATLPLSAIDLDRGWIDYPRPKTGIARRLPLWPATIEAIRQAVSDRPEPKKPEYAELAFLTRTGTPWAKESYGSAITHEMDKLLREIEAKRPGLSFYTLRHVFRTVADESKDQTATDHIMGHEIANMSVVYRETISDERLQAVTEYVRAWLFAPTAPAKEGGVA